MKFSAPTRSDPHAHSMSVRPSSLFHNATRSIPSPTTNFLIASDADTPVTNTKRGWVKSCSPKPVVEPPGTDANAVRE